ncbi:MAG: zinc ribbon domain-containing protein [Longimicrobiaceae bacterium]
MDSLDRLYQKLLDALPGGGEKGAVTIAEIYQNLIPYRTIRSELGFSELPQYEHVLLRLLAGERGYLRVDHPQVREEFERELKSSNPIVGLYRDYAAVGVTLEGAREPPLTKPAAVDRVPAVPAKPETSQACPSCDARLPGGGRANFCPHCGTPLGPVPCSGCGAALRPEWKYCVSCGRSRGGG